MNFAIFGGDNRSLRLCALLRADGHGVTPFALERVMPDCVSDPAEALHGADGVILPLPCDRNGLLNAPFSAESHTFPQLLAAAPPGLPVLAGKTSENLRAVCRRQKLALSDYFLREDFTLRNAALTAEGAVSLLLTGENALCGSRVLITGFGRIGRMLAGKLRALGASVTVGARKSEDRALAEALGCQAISLSCAVEGTWDAVVNTIPAQIFDRSAIQAFGEARCIELASAPYGFDLEAAAALEKQIELAPGLPGKTAPLAAAAAVRDAIYGILEG